LLLPATSLMRGAPPPWLSRESKGMRTAFRLVIGEAF
jgi:hypothetical protein